MFKPQEDQIYWAEVQTNGFQPSLHAAPLHIGPLMQRHLWHEKTSVILTSATLTAAGEFDYLRGRLSAEDADELALGSPFDYETAALLYLANDIPEPNDRNGHQRAMETGLIQLVPSHRRAHSGAVHLLRPAQAHFTGYRPGAGAAMRSWSTNRARAPRRTPCWRPSATPSGPSCWGRALSGRAWISRAMRFRCW